jgi:glyoxylase-like metal-dependent hydrolase (beta-lactamase superfamily II)
MVFVVFPKNGAPAMSRFVIAIVAGLTVWACVLSAAKPASDDARAPRRIADGVVLIPGHYRAGLQPDGNTLVFEAPRGLVVMDTGRHAHHAQRILEHAAASGKPVVAIVNSHWHLDHISGNPAIRDAWPDAEVYGSLAIDGALKGFLADYRSQLLEAIAKTADDAQAARWRDEVARIDSGPRLRPTAPIDAGGERVIGGKTFRIGFANAATEGDLWVYDPERRVLAAGDLITLPAPFFDTACPQRWREAFRELAALDFEVVVPGHGEPMDREQFNTYRRAFNNLLVCAAAPTGKHICIEAWKRDAAALAPPEMHQSVDDLLSYYFEMGLRSPADADDCRA